MEEAFYLSEDLMSMHGILYKKGRNFMKKYKKRWFALRDNAFFLKYYSSPSAIKEMGEIDILYMILPSFISLSYRLLLFTSWISAGFLIITFFFHS